MVFTTQMGHPVQVMKTNSQNGFVTKVLFNRIIRSAEFGLYEKWIEMSKQEYFKWRLAMKNSGRKVGQPQ